MSGNVLTSTLRMELCNKKKNEDFCPIYDLISLMALNVKIHYYKKTKGGSFKTSAFCHPSVTIEKI